MHPLALLLVTAPFGAAVLAPLAIALEREQVVHYLLEPRWSGLGGASTAVLVLALGLGLGLRLGLGLGLRLAFALGFQGASRGGCCSKG